MPRTIIPARIRIDAETTDATTAAAEALACLRRDRFQTLPTGGASHACHLWLLTGDPTRPQAVIEILSAGPDHLTLHPMRVTETGELAPASHLSTLLPTSALDTAGDPQAISRLATAISRSHKDISGEG